MKPVSAHARAFIGLGSNMPAAGLGPYTDERRAKVENLARAVSAFVGPLCQDRHQIRCSPVYESRALGPKQPTYANAVALLQTPLDPYAVLDTLQALETRFGRTRAGKWGPRTLDLDLLLYFHGAEDDPQTWTPVTIDGARLRVPHPELAVRDFVLAPLLDLHPTLKLPDGRAMGDLLDNLDPHERHIIANLGAIPAAHDRAAP